MTERTTRYGVSLARPQRTRFSSVRPSESALAPRKLPKQGRAVATFTSILDAAAELIVRDGLEKPTTNHIADRAGANIGSLYQYFSSKASIVAALVDRALETYESSMTEAFFAVRDLPLHDGFEALVRAHVAALQKDAPVVRVLLKRLGEVDRDDAYRATRRRMLEAFTAYVTAHGHETYVEDLVSASRIMIDCVEAISLSALFDRGAELGSDPRVIELICIARRYLLLRA